MGGRVKLTIGTETRSMNSFWDGFPKNTNIKAFQTDTNKIAVNYVSFILFGLWAWSWEKFGLFQKNNITYVIFYYVQM